MSICHHLLICEDKHCFFTLLSNHGLSVNFTTRYLLEAYGEDKYKNMNINSIVKSYSQDTICLEHMCVNVGMYARHAATLLNRWLCANVFYWCAVNLS